ncbi:MAG TPA: MBL fold metallo-hydrolase [Verrucomicrobia bacterium]|nr:MBL fold metallo-hydrolase [Verrucomicrobiota bacterium]
MAIKATFLGTGTSSGVPIIGCDCPVCTSEDPRDRRRRTSLYIEAGGLHVLVDTPPDLREQALAYRLPRVDAVFFTHSHADHIFGFDDIRRYNTIQREVIPAFGGESTIRDLQRVFNYISTECQPGAYRPQIDFRIISYLVNLGALTIEMLPVVHGPAPTNGFLFTCDAVRFAYVPDCKVIPPETLARLKGVDVMVLDALRHRDHATHLTIAQSLSYLEQIGAARSYLIHLCHEVAHAELEHALPAGVAVAYDGLCVQC